MLGPIHKSQVEVDPKDAEYFKRWYELEKVEEKAVEASMFSKQFLSDGMVSVSGGKDSMVMLHLIYNHASKDIVVFHWDHGPWLMPRSVEEEILENIRRVAPKAKLVVERFEEGWRMEARWRQDKWYKAFFSTLRRLADEGYRHHLLGVRRDESSRRRVRGRIAERQHWVEVHPIYHFTWRDAWSYVFHHQVPVPKIYFEYAKLIGWENARLVTFHDKEFEKHGTTQIDSVLMWRSKAKP